MAKTTITYEDVKRASDEAKKVKAEYNSIQADMSMALDSIMAGRRARHESRFAGEHDDDPSEYAEYKRLGDELNKAKAKLDAADLVAGRSCSIHMRQVKNLVCRAMLEHIDEYIGKPAHYKRTKALLESIANTALEGTGYEARAWCYKDRRYDCRIHIAPIELSYGTARTIDLHLDVNGDGELCDEYARNWYKPDERVDGITIADVRRMCRKYVTAKAKLEAMRDEYAWKCHKVIDEFDVLGKSDPLTDACKIDGYQIRSAKEPKHKTVRTGRSVKTGVKTKAATIA